MVPVLTRSAACLALVLCGVTPVTAITFGVNVDVRLDTEAARAFLASVPGLVLP